VTSRILAQAVVASLDHYVSVSEELDRRLRANEQRRRAEQGRPLRQSFIARFERATGHTLTEEDFLPLSESEQLMTHSWTRIQAVPVEAQWHDLSPLVYAALAAIANSVGDAHLYLSAAYSNFMGMPKVPVGLLLSHMAVFWMPEDEEIRLVSDDAEHGLRLEWNDDWIELRTWGWIHEAVHRKA
jgi:hypothetical protein